MFEVFSQFSNVHIFFPSYSANETRKSHRKKMTLRSRWKNKRKNSSQKRKNDESRKRPITKESENVVGIGLTSSGICHRRVEMRVDTIEWRFRAFVFSHNRPPPNAVPRTDERQHFRLTVMTTMSRKYSARNTPLLFPEAQPLCMYFSSWTVIRNVLNNCIWFKEIFPVSFLLSGNPPLYSAILNDGSQTFCNYRFE